jgi:GT2 family glycosyltransferase/tetratricopeptide (TPR) repeat protein
MPRYLFGPLPETEATNLLGRHLKSGDCIDFDTTGWRAFGLDETWNGFAARLPAGWLPDFIVLNLAYRRIPRGIWNSPLPIVALAPDWNLQWHFLRRICKRCELVLTDAKGVETFQRQGIAQVKQATLFGLEQCWLETTDVGKRDIDVLFIGNFHPAVHAERSPWLGRLAAVGKRWNVKLLTQVNGKAYRDTMRCSRIVFNRSLRGECNKRTFEAAAAGVLLFQEAENLEIRNFFRDREECVLYTNETLESLLHHYLANEDERQRVANAAHKRYRSFTFEAMWMSYLREIEAILPELRLRRQQRQNAVFDVSMAMWELAGTEAAADERLHRDLDNASAEGSAHVTAERGIAHVWGATDTNRANRAAIDCFQEAVTRDPNQIITRLNLAVAHSTAGNRQETINEARTALNLLESDYAASQFNVDSSFIPRRFNFFRVEWEKAAYLNAGRPAVERSAKLSLIKWRLHRLLAGLTGAIAHHYEAVFERPDLVPSRCTLAEALTHNGQLGEASHHLKVAWRAQPFDPGIARQLFDSLKDFPAEQRRLVSRVRLLHKAAPMLVPPQEWFVLPHPNGTELTSIIILCCNEVDVSRLCIESVLRHTRQPYELIIVDNGSIDGTPRYLELLKGRHGPSRVEIIRNETNLGFAKGCNQGFQKVAGDYLVLLNNDTIVTPQWLESLIAWSLHNWPNIGMVGPTSNYAPAPQLVLPAYRTLDELDVFARRVASEKAGRSLRHTRLTGFCLLIRRDVFKEVGGFDERYGLGFFEDDDLCIRVRHAGYELLVALNVYIHHFGSRTFSSLGIDCHEALRRNLGVFKEKWGDGCAAGYRLPRAPVGLNDDRSADDNAGYKLTMYSPAPLQAECRRPRVTLTMIVKNEEHHLPDCLTSVADLVDEIVVVDTGSTDATKAVARRFGARVFDFPWIDSFAAARNESMRHANGEWVLWMDADDRFDAANRDKLRRLLQQLPNDNAGFVMKCICMPDPETHISTIVDHVRLFRNVHGMRWKYRVHEQILGAIRTHGGMIRWTDIVVNHVGYIDKDVRLKKLERDMKLLLLENAEDPDEPFVLFNLGSIYREQGNIHEALRCLERSLQLSHPNDSIVRKLYALIAECYRRLGQPHKALAICNSGQQHYPDDADILFQEGITRQDLKDLDGAVDSFRRLRQPRSSNHFASVDAGLCGYRALHCLGVLYRAKGDIVAAEQHWQEALNECAEFLPSLQELGELYLGTGRWDDLERVIRRLNEHPHGKLEADLFRARVWLARKEFEAARSVLAAAIEMHPTALGPRVLMSRVYLQEGSDAATAERALQDVLRIAPEHPEATHNLLVLRKEHRIP